MARHPSHRRNQAFEHAIQSLEQRLMLAADLRDAIRITEIHYHPTPEPQSPYAADSFEFIELKNISNDPVNLLRARFTEGVEFEFGDVPVAPGESVVLVRSVLAFNSLYTDAGARIAGEFGPGGTALSDAGERVKLVDDQGRTIHDFSYDDEGGWPTSADGGGVSIVIRDPLALVASWNDPASWQPGFRRGTPGADNFSLPTVQPIINEIMSSTDEPAGDWIELYNPGLVPLDISHWWLTDEEDTPRKYQLQPGSIIPPGGYFVLEQFTHFGVPGAPGVVEPFGLSSQRDGVYLFSANPFGVLDGFRIHEEFAGSEKEISFGIPSGLNPEAYGFVSLQTPTKGGPNSSPIRSPIVINEIMYETRVSSGPIEFVELHNASDQPVSIGGWEFKSGIQQYFPPGTVIPPRGFLIVAGSTPEAFRAAYEVSADVQVVGPFQLTLDSDGDELYLYRPGYLFPDGSFSYIRVDQVVYSDERPWPKFADGWGSLARIDPDGFGSDPYNWGTDPGRGSPGRPNFVQQGPPILNKIELVNDPATNLVGAIRLHFSEPIPFAPEGVLLYRNTGSGSQDNIRLPVPVTSDGGITWRYEDLAAITSVPGEYFLRVQDGFSRDASGLPLANNGSANFSTSALVLPASAGVVYTLEQAGANVEITGTPAPTVPFAIDEPMRLIIGGDANVASLDAPQLQVHGVASALIHFDPQQRLAGLHLTDSSRAVLGAPSGHATRLRALTIRENAALDLADGALILSFTDLDQLKAHLKNGRGVAPGGVGNAPWNGERGIRSGTTAARFHGSEAISIGYGRNGSMLNPFRSFLGQSVDADDVLVRCTRNGDATLDGKVDNNDITVLAGFYRPGQSGKHWYQADFNYDGEVNNNDITILAGFYRPNEEPVAPEKAVASDGVSKSSEPSEEPALLFSPTALPPAFKWNSFAEDNELVIGSTVRLW